MTNAKENKSITLPIDIEDSKLYKKMISEFGEDETRIFLRKSESDLRAVIAECQVQEAEARQAVEENDAYKNAKSICDIMKKGLREVVKPLKLKSSVATFIVTYSKDAKSKDQTQN